MGNIAGALESPRFTTLPRPSSSDAIYLPNCSSDAFITLLDLSPYNKKKKNKTSPPKKKANPPRTKFLSSLRSPLDRGGGKGVRVSAAETRRAAASRAGAGSAERDGRLGRLRLRGHFLGRELGMSPGSWQASSPYLGAQRFRIQPK